MVPPRRGPIDVIYHVDVATTDEVVGWCVGEERLREVRCVDPDGLLGATKVILRRPGVQSDYPARPHSLESGFAIQIQAPPSGSAQCWLEFEFADDRCGTSRHFELKGLDAELPTLPAGLELEGQSTADYLLYIGSMWAKFRFIERHFPRCDPKRPVGSKDRYCRGSSALEMLHIANHIYRLRKRGLEGAVCEFGCFKGFSTACLSHACHEAALTLEVFDSFAGLPDSDSEVYEAGEFCGTLDEVRANVEQFGRLASVRFNPGFFNNSLAGARLTPLLFWMDVDLRSSSADVMTILDQLPAESCVLSHECSAERFEGGEIVRHDGVDDVIAPILEAMKRLGRPVAGTYLTGDLGAFWDAETGLRPLSNETLREVLALAG